MGYIVVLGTKKRNTDLLKASEENLAHEAKAAEDWKELLETKGLTVDHSTFRRLAERHGLKGGKWIVHLHTSAVDGLWKKAAWCLAYGKMPEGCVSLSVTPLSDAGGEEAKAEPCMHVLSAWNRDSGVEGEVRAVEAVLRSEVGIRCSMTYKPDIFSAVGIYRNNEWRLRPAIYQSRFRAGQSKVESGRDPNWKFTVGQDREETRQVEQKKE